MPYAATQPITNPDEAHHHDNDKYWRCRERTNGALFQPSEERV